jgi:hypothetical protein
MRTFIAYAWRVVSNVIQVIVVFYVFAHLNDRLETIVVSILGLIYVTIRSIAFGQWYVLANFGIGMERDFVFIRKLVGDDVAAREELLADAQKGFERLYLKFAIDGVALAIISLTCLIQLFSIL